MNITVEPECSIQNAIDAVHADGGGRVIIPAGKRRLMPITLKSGVELHLEHGALLCASDNLADYSYFTPPGMMGDISHDASSWGIMALISADRAENIAITGSGIIDARGPAFFDTTPPKLADTAHDPTGSLVRGMYKKPNHPRPRLLVLSECRDVLVAGVTFKDSPSWTTWISECDGVTFRDMRITGDLRMINNDGIHLDSCKHVRINNCRIETGDDSIIVRAIPKHSDRRQYSRDVVISNCVLSSSCQGIRIGCPSDGNITDVAIANLTISGYNGIAFDNPARYVAKAATTKLHTDRIVISNVTIDVSNRPLWMEIGKDVEVERLGGVSFNNIRMRGGAPCLFAGNDACRLENISFHSVEFDRAPEIRRCKELQFDSCKIAD